MDILSHNSHATDDENLCYCQDIFLMIISI